MKTPPLTTDAAAELCGVTPGRIRQIARGYAIGSKHGRDWSFSPADIRSLQKLLKNFRKTDA